MADDDEIPAWLRGQPAPPGTPPMCEGKREYDDAWLAAMYRVEELYADYNVDPGEDRAEYKLIQKIADGHPRQGGAPKRNDAMLCQLAADIEFIRHAHPGEKLPDAKICEDLADGKCEHVRTRYKGQECETLRRRLQEGRKRLDELVGALTCRVRRDFKDWSPSHNAKVRYWAVQRLGEGSSPFMLLYNPSLLHELKGKLRGNPL